MVAPLTTEPTATLPPAPHLSGADLTGADPTGADPTGAGAITDATAGRHGPTLARTEALIGLVGDPALAVAPAGTGWETLSHAMTGEAPGIADRDDLTVTIAPGAGQGAPACLIHDHARIEIDGAHLSVDPDTAHPARPADRHRYPTAWGLFTHECGHARHSLWRPPPDAAPGAVRAAMLLEESRIEAAQMRRRPDDRHWLRASATELILADLLPPSTPDTAAPADPATSDPATPDPATPDAAASPAVMPVTPAAGPAAPPTDPSRPDPCLPGPSDGEPAPVPAASVPGTPDPGTGTGTTTPTPAPPSTASTPSVGPDARTLEAAWAATLLLARADAGILDPGEVEPVAITAETVLGPATLARLREIWQAARTVADTDAEQMIELGRSWCVTLGLDPHGPTPTTPGSAAGSAAAASGATGGGSGLRAAVREACARVRIAVAAHPRPADPTRTATATARAEQAARATSRTAADAVFRARPSRPRTTRVGGPAIGVTATAGTRPATDAERAAARVLGRALDTAGARERVATRTRAALPPGRLHMRGALAADAQRAAGALPTAEPFTRTTRRAVPTPPLRLGVACDVSGSMAAFAGPVAATAWILAHAAHHTRVDTTTAAVIFGRHVRKISAPGEIPAQVTEFLATDLYEQIDRAIDALDGALGLALPGAARLLIIVSDGLFRDNPRTEGQARVDRLRTAGCGVLWLAPDHTRITPLRGVTIAALSHSTLSDPTATARAIGRAATTALRTAH